MKDLGEAAYILGIKIIRDRSKQFIALSQSDYLEKILKKIRMENSKKGYTPMMEKPNYRKSHVAKTPSEQNPGEIYWTVVKTIHKYLRNTKDMVLVYGEKPEAELKVSCYADASFQIDKDDTKSQTEAEYIAAAEASMEAVWMRKFIDGLGDVMPSNKIPMEMLYDNEPVIAISADPGFPARCVRSSNAIALDSPYLLVLIIETSQSRQHESRKSPTVELFDDDSGRIFIHHCEY
ncbi:hypothetical protein Tco_0158764 [Tanacetum coccineum]